MNDRSRRARPRLHRKRWWETAAEFSADMHSPGMASPFDPLGSYTGVPIDGEEPVQDTDDI